jgi:hypothetical protein
MKKASVLFMIVVSTATVLFAQGMTDKNSKDFSLCGSLAYGFGVGGQWIDESVKYNGAAIQDKSDKYLNYGDGFKLELGGMYKLMEYLDAQAVFSYNAGVPSIEAVNQNVVPGTQVTNTYKTNTFGIKAMVLPRVKILDLLDMYTGFGLGLYFGWLSWTNSETTFDGNYKTSPALAFCGTIGANYPVYNDLILYGEIALEQMSFTITSILSALDGRQTNFEQDSKATSGVLPPDKIPGSNVAFRVGVKFPIF